MLNSGVNSRYSGWKMYVSLLAKQPAPCFYISPKIAERYVHSYYRGEPVLKTAKGRALIKDLVENYERLKANNPDDYAYQIWDKLVECPAKSFYLKESVIKHIVYGYYRKATTNL